MNEIVTCDACPVLCRIRLGKTGACDRYGNVEGTLTRMEPLTVLARNPEMVRFAGEDWTGNPIASRDLFVTAIGAGTTYPDYKPAPFIVGSEIDGIDMITVVTEGVFSYCGLKVKIDTDRHLGPEAAPVLVGGEQVGHVTTAEYGSQMLSLGGVRHLTGGSKREGVATCEALLALCNKQPVELRVDGGASVVVQANRAPVVDGVAETRMRVGCGSATIGIFAGQWHGHADEVIVVDDHITGVLTEHQAGKFLGMRPAGIRVRGRRSTPGRYFQVANPGMGWGGTDIADPLAIVERVDAKLAWPGLRLLMVSTTGEHAAWFVLDDALRPVAVDMPAAVAAAVARIGENCEAALCSVLFMAGAGGSLRAGATENPVLLTRAVQSGRARVTSGGAPVFVWPGGGITYMADVSAMPDASFGSVPTPALVAPIEFTLRRDDYLALGGHSGRIRPLAEVLAETRPRVLAVAGAIFPRPPAGETLPPAPPARGGGTKGVVPRAKREVGSPQEGEQLPSPLPLREGPGEGFIQREVSKDQDQRRRRPRQANRGYAVTMRGEPTPAERALWRALRNDQLHGLTFRRQAPIGHYIVDFFCPTARLIIEIDHETHADPTRDATRTQWLEAHNLRILRFRNNEVLANLDGVLQTIAEHAA